MRKFLALVAIVFTLSGTAQAQDWDKGLEAYLASDFAAALQEFRPLAEHGRAAAQKYLGDMYLYGQGVSQDDKEAGNWYRKAAEQGDANAQFWLGTLYKDGWGVPKDNALSHMWVNISSANGHLGAADMRDIVAKKMTAKEISKAQAMALECVASGYQNCGY